MNRKQEGPLEAINVRFEKTKGEEFKKAILAAKTILDSIGLSTSNKG